jgi:peroxiredoxin
MRKSYNIIIWVVALALVIAAAYTYYTKNKTEGAGLLPRQNQSQSGTPGTSGASQPATTRNNGSQDTSQSGVTGSESTQSDKVMAPDFTLKDLDGNPVKLSDYRGKIVILNFWAVWCKYCKLEMPDLNELDKELKKGTDAVILAVDVQESADTVKNYLTSNSIGLKALLDEDGSVAQSYGVSGYPTTFAINPDGSVYTYISGQTDKKTLQKIIDMIKNGEPLK